MTGRNGASEGDAAVAAEAARLASALRSSTGPEREQAVSALAALGEHALAPLLAELGDREGDTEDGDVRAGIAQALGKIGDLRAVDPLLAIFADEAEPCDVRVEAALALGAIRDPRALEPLLRFIDEPNGLYNHDATAGWFVVDALGMLGDVRALPLLVEAIASPVPSLRWSAAEALGHLGDARGVGALLTALDDRDPTVACRAAEALGKLGDPQALLALHRIHDDASDEPLAQMVRRAASAAIARIGARHGEA